MVKISPCRCGAVPLFTPYKQSNDGNHDIPASVTCPTCGRSTVMDWHMWLEAEEEVGDEKYERPTAYLSSRFMNALGDATIRKWNRENGGRVMDDATMTATFVPSPEFRKILDELSVAKVEYVVEDPIFIEATTKSGETMRYPTAVRERVVRCRDCKHGDPFCDSSSYAGMINCLHFAQWDYYDDEPGVCPVKPDGFCAWGERGEA